ncbi:DUF551 domain-containing protein [Klebsiella pneumoniae]|uniref:DUF551 domain-containing protein n=1 Tax=Klebsiella pneumoniae TaxID=573 RepID=UPI0011DE001F|nr:DUF551 domain-containing protein [Klebsiella pneumoniae]TXW13579.1 DUF551 domain-containing protein [Klebsiella pneumoniae]
MTKSTITRERLQEIAGDGFLNHGESKELARMALAAMDSESGCLPLDYLQGHKDGLEWAAQLAEANRPETGDWLYDDPIELAKAIRKGPDMPPVHPVVDREPDRNPVLAYADSYRDMAKQGVESVPIWSVITDLERNIAPLYLHAQPATVVQCPFPCGWDNLNKLAIQDAAFIARCLVEGEPTTEAQRQAAISNNDRLLKVISAYRASMLAAAPQSPGSDLATVPGKWIPVSERMPESNGVYFGWDGKRVLEVNCFFGGFSANQFIHGEITHWMPLPAAPQEVKGE